MIKSTGAFILIGLLAGTAAASPQAAFTQVNGVWERNPDGCGTHQIPRTADPLALAPPAPAVGLRTVYLNRFGGTYTVGNVTDAAVNRVHRDIIQGNLTQFTIPPLNTTTFNWQAISQCVRTHFRQFNVLVVETEPTNGMPFIEAVVGGNGQEIGFGANELFGIASADNFCGVTERGIALNFSETHRNVPRRDDELCATIAHEVGHLIALEHEQLPTDIMSYVLIADSSTKAFVNQSSGCGTSPQDQMMNCTCGGTQTSSYGRLSTFIGLRNLETVPPVLSIDAPGDIVPPTFEVVVTATDNAMMSEVKVLVDNADAGTDSEAENNVYKITVRGLSEGSHQLSVIAFDAAGNMTRKDTSITVRKLATGETCIGNEACTGNICAQIGDDKLCTQACEASSDTCPDGFECTAATSGSTVCVPSPESGCGCASSRNPGPMFLLALALGAALRRRRRR